MSTSPKITEPNYLIVRFYFHYSYCTLIISWIFAPILFYIILTQSKKLGNFKWFILNHSFWCLIHSTFCALVKPIILTPAAAGYQIGIFSNIFGYQSSTVFAAINLGLSCNCVVGVCATVGSRYLLIFTNGIFQWFNLKIALIFAIFVHLLCYFLIGFVFYPLIFLDQSLMLQWGRDYDIGLEKYFKEPTFFMIPHSYHDIADILTLIFFAVTHICGGGIFGFFAYHIFTQKSSQVLTNQLQRSLIISSMLQMGLTSAFLFSPFMFFFFVIRFDIPDTSTLMTIFLCIGSTHCLIEFIVTLYFISPYRSFISRHLRDPRVSFSNVSLISPSF